MTFHAIKATPGSRREPVLVSLRRLRATPRVRLTLHPDFLKQLGWHETTNLQPYLGEGADHGLVMVKPATERGYRLRGITGSSRLALEFNVPAPVPEAWAACEPDMKVDTIGKSLTIRLPWAQKLRAVG